MSTVACDTLELASRLRESSCSGDLATRSDVASLPAEIADVKAEIIKWMFGAMLAQGALVVTLIKLIPGK